MTRRTFFFVLASLPMTLTPLRSVATPSSAVPLSLPLVSPPGDGSHESEILAEIVEPKCLRDYERLTKQVNASLASVRSADGEIPPERSRMYALLARHHERWAGLFKRLCD